MKKQNLLESIYQDFNEKAISQDLTEEEVLAVLDDERFDDLTNGEIYQFTWKYREIIRENSKSK